MGVKGNRIKKDLKDEPTLLGNVKNIIENAKGKGLITKYSVDIEAIVREQGIQIKMDELPNSFSGYLKKVNDKWIIGVNKNHNIKRQRFTIAHELAHYILHRRAGQLDDYYEDTTFFRKENDSSIEYKANEFAAELLMPEELFNDAVKNGKRKIIELAEMFNLSVQAIKYRAKELGFNIKNNG